MARILVAGCGYVGAAAARLFHEQGWEVEGWTATQASAESLAQLPFPVRAVDISRPEAVAAAAAARDFDAVVQSVSSRGGGAEEYRRIYLEGARNLTSAFPHAQVLFTSSTSVYAQREGEWVTERSPAEPQRETSRILRETEELVLGRGGIVARLAGIYGPGRSALLRKFLASTAVLDRASSRFVNQVHRDDAAAALLLLIQQQLSGRIFNVSDNHPRTQHECSTWLAAHFGAALPPTSDGPAERKRGDTNKRVSSEQLLAVGWLPRYPTFEIAMRDSILPNLEQLGA